MAGRANRRRGEIEAIIDGERRILCLTLGALAELETALGVDNIADLAARFATGRIGTSAIIAIVAAGLRGGGNITVDEDVADMCVDGGIEGAVRLAARLLAAAFPEDAETQQQNPPQPQPAD
ncbi:gene transfer agent family protein [Rhizobium sp. KVB221]|uniref:Gene transfer agent family protein n=1 Tax=Rhizobium setariae TaxID=2801340 RepID=A0A937CJG4_9HYPH|nr:gene transfer agent family protein [Rhizobium setariae]MBL0371075.1 gene transfer agent family protein [Rhizobium setariae]